MGSSRGSGVRSSARTALVLTVPLSASCLVAAVAGRESELAAPWLWFVLWVAAVVCVPLVLLWPPRLDLAHALRRRRWELASVLGLTVAAAFVRGIDLGSLPEPFSGDEASFAIRGIWVREGQLTNMFQSGFHGTPNLYFFLLAGFEGLFGTTAAAVRSSSVVLGTLALPATYVFLRQLFDRAAALAGGLFLAAYHFHVHFSRQALPNVSDTLLLPLLFLFAHRVTRGGRLRDYGLTGFVLGLSLYGWATVRVAPLVLLAFWAWWSLANRRLLPGLVPGLGVLAICAVVAAAPLGWWWLQHPSEFNTRFNQVGIHQRDAPEAPTWFEQERQRGRSAIDIYRGQAQDVLDATFLEGETSPFYRSPVPLVDRWTIIVFAIGCLIALRRLADARYALLLLMLAAPLVGGGILTEPPVSAARLVGIITPVVALVGIGAAAGSRILLRRRPELRSSAAALLVLPAVVFSAVFYFDRYAAGEFYSDAATRSAEAYAAGLRRTVPPGATVYWLATDDVNPGHPTLDFGLRSYVVRLVAESGEVSTHQNLYGLPERAAGVAYAFAGRMSATATAFAVTCPGGELIDIPVPETGAIVMRVLRDASADCLGDR